MSTPTSESTSSQNKVIHNFDASNEQHRKVLLDHISLISKKASEFVEEKMYPYVKAMEIRVISELKLKKETINQKIYALTTTKTNLKQLNYPVEEGKEDPKAILIQQINQDIQELYSNIPDIDKEITLKCKHHDCHEEEGPHGRTAYTCRDCGKYSVS
jgi:wyosine [tRNA(Phe)-imidazoG37] synthetase (radical SAM superfamily)